MGKKSGYKVDFKNMQDISNYGENLIKSLLDSVSVLDEESKANEFSEESLIAIKDAQINLQSFLQEVKSQFTEYLISSVLEIDNYTKEELVSFKNRVNAFNNRLNYMSSVLEKSNDQIWDMYRSRANEWRKK